jgi:NurA-like 5'-3' nuclease
VVNEVGSEKMPNEKWVYSDSDLTIVKFHEKSGFCYRLEAPKKDNLIKTIGVISYYSKDPEILGYPYPLLKADKVARVKDFEKEMENAKVKMLAKSLGKNFIETDEKSTIMHSLLDKRAYR